MLTTLFLFFILILIFSHIIGWLTNKQLDGDTGGYAPVSGQLLDQRLLNGGLPPRRGYRDSMISIDGAGMCKYLISDAGMCTYFIFDP